MGTRGEDESEKGSKDRETSSRRALSHSPASREGGRGTEEPTATFLRRKTLSLEDTLFPREGYRWYHREIRYQGTTYKN